MAENESKAPPVKNKRPDGPREQIIGSDSGPEKPFPLRIGGKIVSGFGRGSKELGIPTANLPVEDVPWITDAQSGVYFGWASIQLPPSHPALKVTSESSLLPSTTLPDAPPTTLISPISPPSDKLAEGWRIYPMVMSIGYNPFYKNTVRSAEVHVMRRFEKDFYDSQMRVCIMGFVRPEYDYDSLEALVDDIKQDIVVSGRCLERDNWGPPKSEESWLWGNA